MAVNERKPVLWAETERDLLSTQIAVVRRILGSCVPILLRSLTDAKDQNEDLRTVWNPHEAFCIDGGRGSGKTVTLGSIPHLLDALSNNFLGASIRRRSKYEDWQKTIDTVVSGTALKEALGSYSKIHSNDGPDDLTQILRIIFPGDMEGGESVMENLFAALAKEIENGISDGSKNQRKIDKYLKLKEQLREVAKGFYFAKRFGVDAIIRDSVDYNDLVLQFERQSDLAVHRIQAWRTFIYDYLSIRNIPVLVVLFDDSDVEADLTRDILHTIRMFLCHPRIITVLAGNTRSMRDSLVHHGMRRLGDSMKALDREASRTGQDWRQAARKDAEYYLEKVLPQERRFYLGHPTLSIKETSGRKGQPDQSDFHKVANRTLRDVVSYHVQTSRGPFLDTKFRLAIEYENGRVDAPGPTQRNDVERFLSWWLFQTRYAKQLSPRSPRQINTFQTYYAGTISANQETPKHGSSRYRTGMSKSEDPNETSPQSKGSHDAAGGDNKHDGSENPDTKRLPVMLYDVPENWTLIQRLSDEDPSVSTWLWHQDLQSAWTGQRGFRINGRAVYQGTYTYDYIAYRLDLNLATPMRKNSDESVPKGLLPRLRGRQYMRRLFQPVILQKQQRRVGLSRWIDHAALPGNGVYFADVAALPDLSFVPEGELKGNTQGERSSIHDERSKGEWEANLAGRWMELLAEEQHEVLVRYLTEVTFDRLHGTGDIESSRLIKILGDKDNSYIDFLKNELEWIISPATAPTDWQDQKRRLRNDEQGLDDTSRTPNNNGVRNSIARHAALITDLRRAWHAIRIHEAAPQRPLEGVESAGPLEEIERTSSAFVDNQARMALFNRSNIEELIRRGPWIDDFLNRLAAPEFPTLGGRLFQYEWKHDPGRDPQMLGDPTDAGAAAEQFDYRQWSETLRKVGRAICEGWPLGIEEAEKDKGWNEKYPTEGDSFEKTFFDYLRLKISTSHEKLDEKEQELQSKYGRQCRNFTLLLYGLGPSLSAIIHANLMAAVLQRTLLDEDWKEYIAGEIKKWATLVGHVSILLRYIKIKSMHLFAKLFLDSMYRSLCSSATSELSEAAAAAVRFLAQCGISIAAGEKADLEDVKIVVWTIKTRFGCERAEHLAMMPDIAPSTLFGDKWMTELLIGTPKLAESSTNEQVTDGNLASQQPPASEPAAPYNDVFKKDIIARANADAAKKGKEPIVAASGELKYEPAEPWEVRGIFSETEQWLWATNRCLRNWSEAVKKYDRSGKPLEGTPSS